jgi:hypothetical protein
MKSKISSTGGSMGKVGLILLSYFLMITFYNQFDFSLMAFVTLVICFTVFFYLFVILFYDPKVIYDENYIYFKKFYKDEEVIPLKQIVRLSQNAQAYTGGLPGKYSYRIDYINYNGKSGAVSFYSEESQEINIKEFMASVRKVNPYFIVDWTVPKRVR